MNAAEGIRILLLLNDAAEAERIRGLLAEAERPFDLVLAPRLTDGLDLLRVQRFDLVLLDMNLPDSRSAAACRLLLRAFPGTVVVALAADAAGMPRDDALNAGAQDCLSKASMTSQVLWGGIDHATERAAMVERAERQARELDQREGLLRTIFEADADAMLIMTERCEIRLCNPAAGHLLEADAQALIGEIFPFDVTGMDGSEIEIPVADGDSRLVELSSVALEWQGSPAILVILRDVTERHRAETRLREEQKRIAVTLDSIADGVVVVDATGKVERMNAEAARIAAVRPETEEGRAVDEVIRLYDHESGQAITGLGSPPDALESDVGSMGRRMLLKRRNGGDVLVDFKLRPIPARGAGPSGCVLVLRDITDEKQNEDAFFQTEKLRSISLLAGGIAHDFNNILTAIIGNISVVRTGMEADAQGAEQLEAAEKAALQAKSLTQQLLTFSKEGAPVAESTTIDELVEDCVQFILRGSNVRCDIEKTEGLWPVEVDKGQVSQVVNNLIINADQAMPEGGVIRVDITNCPVRPGACPGLEPGDYVCLSVADEGCGIPVEHLKRIFDPYFTTKKEGNGLGLSSSYSIIRNHGGLLTVDSVEGEGATFKAYLPRSPLARPAVEGAERGAEASPEADKPLPEGGRILVMDDMEAMMTVAGEILKALGFEVAFSMDGEEAIEAYKAAKASNRGFDAVVFDLTVPGGMGGEEACKRLRAFDPGLKAIASSGYTTSSVMSDFRSAGFQAVVPKPYRIEEMREALRRIL